MKWKAISPGAAGLRRDCGLRPSFFRLFPLVALGCLFASGIGLTGCAETSDAQQSPILGLLWASKDKPNHDALRYDPFSSAGDLGTYRRLHDVLRRDPGEVSAMLALAQTCWKRAAQAGDEGDQERLREEALGLLRWALNTNPRQPETYALIADLLSRSPDEKLRRQFFEFLSPAFQEVPDDEASAEWMWRNKN